MARAYYNEIDPYAAQWLRNLIVAGHIAPGDVDERSIENVTPADLAGYTQCHFFAGIGIWSYALRAAGWPDSRPAWTGSCPCQPFSAAGKGAGFADERHLWPAWAHLIAQCRPSVIFGEQVASKDADPWVDLVHADLEGMGYAFGCVPFPSAGIGAPHIRDRAYWVADSNDAGLEGWRLPAERAAQRLAGPRGVAGRLGDTNGRNSSTKREQRSGQQRQQPEDGCACGVGNPAEQPCKRHAGRVSGPKAEVGRQGVADGRIPIGPEHASSGVGGLADAARSGRREECTDVIGGGIGNSAQGVTAGLVHGGGDHLAGPTNGFWRAADWLGCTDGKWRPVEPSTFPLAHGAANRVGRLRAYGNAINAEAAREFILAYAEARGLTLAAEAMAA